MTLAVCPKLCSQSNARGYVDNPFRSPKFIDSSCITLNASNSAATEMRTDYVSIYPFMDLAQKILIDIAFVSQRVVDTLNRFAGFEASRSTQTQDKNDEAIRLFQMRRNYFHFLLTTDMQGMRTSSFH